MYVSSECSQELHQLVSSCHVAGYLSCRRLPRLAQTQKQNQPQIGVYLLTKALKLVLLSNSYPFLPNTQGRTPTNWWNLRKIGGAICKESDAC
jgi:hypothetical protein